MVACFSHLSIFQEFSLIRQIERLYFLLMWLIWKVMITKVLSWLKSMRVDV